MPVCGAGSAYGRVGARGAWPAYSRAYVRRRRGHQLAPRPGPGDRVAGVGGDCGPVRAHHPRVPAPRRPRGRRHRPPRRRRGHVRRPGQGAHVDRLQRDPHGGAPNRARRPQHHLCRRPPRPGDHHPRRPRVRHRRRDGPQPGLTVEWPQRRGDRAALAVPSAASVEVGALLVPAGPAVEPHLYHRRALRQCSHPSRRRRRRPRAPPFPRRRASASCSAISPSSR